MGAHGASEQMALEMRASAPSQGEFLCAVVPPRPPLNVLAQTTVAEILREPEAEWECGLLGKGAVRLLCGGPNKSHRCSGVKQPRAASYSSAGQGASWSHWADMEVSAASSPR